MLPPCEASQHAPFVSPKPLSLPILTTEQIDSETNDQKDDFYDILDKVIESNEEEIKRINHFPSADMKSGKEKYQCNLCNHISNFFTAAEQHHMEHEENELAGVRETLRSIEFERVSYSKEYRHNSI